MTIKTVFRIIVFGVVIILLACLGGLAFVNLSDLNLASPSQQYSKVIHLTYPNNYPENVVLLNSSNFYSSPWELEINVTLQYQGILTENTPVNVSANGNLYDLNFPVKFLSVGFEGANSNVGQRGEILMRNPLNCPQFDYPAQSDLSLETGAGYMRPLLATKQFGAISWDAPGDYTPFMTVWYLNNTSVTYEYPTEKIHVSGSDIAIQERFSIINLWLTIAMLFATSVMLILAILPKKWLGWFVSEDVDTEREDNATPESKEEFDGEELRP